MGEVVHNFSRDEFDSLAVNPGEVEKVIAVPIEECLDPQNFHLWQWDPEKFGMSDWQNKHYTPCYFFKEHRVTFVGWPAYFLNFFLSQAFPDRHKLYFDEQFVWFEHPKYAFHNRRGSRLSGYNFKKDFKYYE